MSFEIKQGDALEVLRTLPSESVHCCVTSPPYWGLRDYGTAKWEGGSEDCDHAAPVSLRRDSPGGFHNSTSRGTQPSIVAVAMQYRDECGKCGAVREDRQLGLEKTPELYVSKMTEVFREVRRALRSDGTLWLNIGDSYASTWSCGRRNAVGNGACDYGSRQIRTGNGLKEKDLCGIPWLLAFALRADGWYLRQDIIWSKPNPMPESVTDRCTKAHEYLFLLSKSARYYYDAEAIAEEANGWNGSNFDDPRDLESRPNTGRRLRRGLTEEPTRHGLAGAAACGVVSMGCGETRNKRSVWEIATSPFPEAHFATFPPKLIEPCILAGCPEGKTVLDPFAGAGTTGLVATRLQRNAILIELNPTYCEMMRNRITQDAPLFHAGAYAPSSGLAESGQGPRVLTDGQEKV